MSTLWDFKSIAGNFPAPSLSNSSLYKRKYRQNMHLALNELSSFLLKAEISHASSNPDKILGGAVAARLVWLVQRLLKDPTALSPEEESYLRIYFKWYVLSEAELTFDLPELSLGVPDWYV